MTQPKLRCPACGEYGSRVVDSRPSLTGGVYRRRECLTCFQRYSTEESIHPYPPEPMKDSAHHNI